MKKFLVILGLACFGGVMAAPTLSVATGTAIVSNGDGEDEDKKKKKSKKSCCAHKAAKSCGGGAENKTEETKAEKSI